MNDKLYIALVDDIAGDEDVSGIWASVYENLNKKATEISGAALLDSLENTLSHFLQIEGPRQQTPTSDLPQTLAMLFEHHVVHSTSLTQGT